MPGAGAIHPIFAAKANVGERPPGAKADTALRADLRPNEPAKPGGKSAYWITAAVAADAAMPEKGESRFIASVNKVVCTLTTSPG